MRKFFTATLLMLASAAYAQQAPAQKQAPSQPETTLKVDVKLVNVYVTVTDDHGAPVGGLKRENFVVQEDGREQKISVFDKESAVPLSIALAIDTSLSTRHDLPLEQASAKRFARAILRPVDALSVYGFSETVSQATGYTAELKRIDEGIDHIRLGAAPALFDAHYATSMSQLDDAFRKISDELRTQYLLAYYPSQRVSNSQFRRIQVAITGPAEGAAYHVRNRAGYYTTKSDF